MKRFLCLIVAILVLLSCQVITFGDEEKFSIDVSNGEDDNVNVSVSYHGEEKPVAVQFSIDYDDQLDCLEAMPGDAISGMTAPTINVVDGKIYFVWDSLDAASEGSFLNLKFKGKTETITDAKIGIDETYSFVFVDENYNPILAPEDIPENVTINIGAVEKSSDLSSGNVSQKTETNENADESKPLEQTEQPESMQKETGYNKGISLEENDTEMSLGERKALNITDGKTENENLVWSSSNENVAVVSEDGEIIAVAPGKTIITVMSEDGEKESTCVVTVTGNSINAKSLQKINPENESKIWIPIAVVVIALISVIGFLVYKKVIVGHKKEEETENETDETFLELGISLNDDFGHDTDSGSKCGK